MAVGLADTTGGVSAGEGSNGGAPAGGGTRPNRNLAKNPQAKPAKANKPRGDGHARDPQKPAGGDTKSDLDFDDPSLEAPTPPKKSAKDTAKPAPTKKPEPAANGRRSHETETTKDGKRRAAPPEASAANRSDSESGDSIDGENDDPYQRLADKYDEKAGKGGKKTDKQADRRETREQAAEDDNLVVGDELADDGDDEGETGERRDIHARRDSEDDEQDDDDSDPFDHPMLARAKAYGISEDDARACGTPEALERMMDVIDAKVKELSGVDDSAADTQAGKKPTEGSQNGDALPAQTGKPGTDAPGTQKLGEGERPFAKLLVKELDKDPTTGKPYLDETSQGILQKIVDHFDDVLTNSLSERKKDADAHRQLQEDFGKLKEHYIEAIRMRAAEELDEYFDGLGDEYEGIFGKGPLDELDSDGAEAKNRAAFVQEMNVYAKGLKSSKQPISRKALRVRVLRGFKPAVEKREENIRRRASEKANRRNRQRIAEPTGRGDRRRELTGDERAVEFATNFSRDHGLRVDDSDDFDHSVI